MDLDTAKEKLDHVIRIGRVEMYKPIQVAEVLRYSRLGGDVDLSDVETYRTRSRHWRDEVTFTLFEKQSTSSARYQDDVWNENAIPPAAMVTLGDANSADGIVEAYIYSFIIDKNRELVTARSTIDSLSSVDEIVDLLQTFESPSLRSSADRLFEILAAAVFKTELSLTSYTISVDRPNRNSQRMSIDNLVDLVSIHPMPLIVDRLGHTNAADAGLDIWTNFGVAVNVKRRNLTTQLLRQVVTDTPIGSLHIVCLDVDPGAARELDNLRKSGFNISVTTRNDLLESVAILLQKPDHSLAFVDALSKAFDKEFPMAQTLGEFVRLRGYDRANLSGRWSPPTIPA